MKKIIWIILLTALFLAGCQQGNDTSTSNSPVGGAVKEFNTAISDFKYNPASVTVNLGDTVRLYVTNNDDIGHGVSLPSFGVNTLVMPGETKIIEFVADKIGAPESFCSTDHGEKLEIKVI